MTNNDIAELLRDVAASYQLKDQNKYKFQMIAYQKAADAVEHSTSDLKDLWEEGKLDQVPGIGPSIASHLGELFSNGKSKHFEELMKNIPRVVFDLMKIPGIGVKTASKLVEQLKLKNIKDLEHAAKVGKIAQLEGFGEQSQKEILIAIMEYKTKDSSRMLLPYAISVADEIIAWLMQNPVVKKAYTLGSSRRKAGTVGDIDLAVAATDLEAAINHFCNYPNASRVLERGSHSAAIILGNGLQIDLIAQTLKSYGALLQHFTGSKHHNVALREFALKKNLSLSEYGIKDLKEKSPKVKEFATEEEFYGFLGLQYIPPELREGTDEIKFARENELPELIELKDVKADLQMHSDFDIETSHDVGASSMQELLEKAHDLDYEYIAFTEHNPSKSRHTQEQIVNLLKQKSEVVKKINLTSKVRAFNSLEIDILPDGSLPVPYEGFDYLDFALVSIHSSFKLPKAEMTKRVLRALSFHPKVKIFAHPTARKINDRDGVDLDWDQIFRFCVENNKWIEINADPMRLDLPDVLVRDAIKNGVKLTLGTDAHHKDAMENMQYGINVARRGWASAKNIVNCLSLKEFESEVKK